LRCQGINRITSSYPKYDLGPINKSVLKTGKIRHVSLPEYIGGSRVRLLIGIKDTAIDPVSLFTLPCGLGVYKSQFKDKFKSRICYGGPSHLFSKVNREVNGSSQSFSIFFSQIANSYRNSLYPALARSPLAFEDDADLPIAHLKESRNICEMPACHELNIGFHPLPITAQDIKILEPEYILNDDSSGEASSMSPKPPGEILEDSVGVHFCSVSKAKFRMEQLLTPAPVLGRQRTDAQRERQKRKFRNRRYKVVGFPGNSPTTHPYNLSLCPLQSSHSKYSCPVQHPCSHLCQQLSSV